MIKDLDFSNYENPIIQVVWEDLPENFTQDKLKRYRKTSCQNVLQ